MREKITIKSVEALTPGQVICDNNPRGFIARRQKTEKVSFGYRYRDKKTGSQHWLALGIFGDITVSRARELALEAAGKVAGRRNPQAEHEQERREAAKAALAEENTVNAVLDEFTKRHAGKLRSANQVAHALDAYVRPAIGAMSIYDVKRRDIVKMLDGVADTAGPVMADRTLAHVRKAFNWQAIRDDEFSTPIVRGMARTKPKELARDRVLADDEIRDIWKALETAAVPPCYPAYVKMLLLCAARRNEVADMNAAEIDGDVWTVPASRYKSNHDHAIPLTKQARELIGEVKGFVFSTTGGDRPFSGFSKAKAALDKQIAKVRKAAGRGKMPRWTLHDLRRTARTLMSRAGVSEDIAERAIGHVIGGVRETYDRWSYADEKRQAFESLAGLVDRILNPQTDNVVQLRNSTDN
jgi:integrase